MLQLSYAYIIIYYNIIIFVGLGAHYLHYIYVGYGMGYCICVGLVFLLGLAILLGLRILYGLGF